MITAVSVVKNSADCIEAMIRGNAVIADRFLFLDNGSTDRTLEILESMQKEGFSIEILKDDNPAHVLQERYLRLIRHAVEQYHTDFVMPVDDDEILCTNDDGIAHEDIKANIEGLSKEDLYYVNWRNYIPTDQDDLSEVNVMARQRFCIDDEPEMTTKVIIPSQVVTEDFTIAYGCHYANGSKIRNHVHLNQIRLAHFPVRSQEQIASKVLVGWINNITIPHRKEGLNMHWERMYAVVKNGGLPTVEMMQAMCMLYREYPNDDEHLNIVCRPIPVPEQCLITKYTTANEVNVMQNLCNNAELIASKYVRLCEKYGEQ